MTVLYIWRWEIFLWLSLFVYFQTSTDFIFLISMVLLKELIFGTIS